MRWGKLAFAVAVGLVACSDTDDETNDAGGLADAGTDAAPDAPDGGEPDLPDPPALPAVPVFTPCPEGWREVDDGDDVVTCDPWPEGGAHDCGPYEAHFPGEPDCTPIGTPCPEGDFPEGLPDDGTVRYVLAGATDGDGSRKHPFGTIGEALGGAPQGTTIAIGKGSYLEEVRLRTGITLRGACVAETEIRSSDPSEQSGVIDIQGAETRLENLRIGQSPRWGVSCLSRARSVHLDDCLLEGTNDYALVSVDCSIDGESIVVRSSTSADPMRGLPLFADTGSTVELRRVVFEHNQAHAAVSGPQTSVRFEDAAIRDTTGVADGAGQGIVVLEGAAFTAVRTAVERCAEAGMWSQGASTITLEDVVIRDTRSTPDGYGGVAIGVFGGAELRASRLLAERNRQNGVVIAASTGALDDVVVRDTRPELGNYGCGVTVDFGGSATFVRGRIEDNTSAGILIDNEDSRIVLEDVAVLDTESRPLDGTWGTGLQVSGEAQLTRVLFEGNHEVSISAVGGFAAVEGRDVVVRDTLPRACAADSCAAEPAGTGLGAYGRASIDLTNLLIERADLCGLQIAFGGSVDLHSGVVADNAIGACVQVDDYDLERLTDAVVYRDNDTNIERTDLPVPQPPPL